MAKYSKDLWNREKDGSRKEQRSFLRYAIVATALFLVFMLVKKDGIITWVQAGSTSAGSSARSSSWSERIPNWTSGSG